jgi:hypothetical protein
MEVMTDVPTLSKFSLYLGIPKCFCYCFAMELLWLMLTIRFFALI